MRAHSREQLSSCSIATVVDTPASSSLAAAPYQQQLALRQPPAAAETAVAGGPTNIA